MLAALGELALGHDGLELAESFGPHHDAVHAALQDTRGQAGLVQAPGFSQHRVALGQQILDRNDLPAARQHHAFAVFEAGQHGLLVSLDRERRHGHVLVGPDRAARQRRHTLHIVARHDDAVHAGFQSQGDLPFVKGRATEIDAGHGAYSPTTLRA